MQQGRDRRSGPDRRRLRQSAAPLYARRCSPPSRKAKPPPSDTQRADRSSSAEDLRVWFPIKRGFLRRTVGHVKAVDGVSLVGARGPDGRRRRRIRLGQDDARPRDPAAHPLGRADRLLRPRASTGLSAKADAAVAARHADRLPGPVRLAVAAHVGRRDRRGGPDRAKDAAQRRRAARASPSGRSPTPASTRRRSTAIRTNSPAASASASPSPARWRSIRNSSCSTSRPRRSTCRCRRRSSICCAICRSGARSPISSFRTI